MMPEITAATRLYALLGDPVSHSLSPRMQNAAMAAARLDAVYVALSCATEDVPGLVAAVAGGVAVALAGERARLLRRDHVVGRRQERREVGAPDRVADAAEWRDGRHGGVRP